MNKKKYVLRNGIVIEPNGEPTSGDVKIISVPKGLIGEGWAEGEELTLEINFPDLTRVLAWTGGAFGRQYDVVRELEGG
jgi:hypothetical protein